MRYVYIALIATLAGIVVLFKVQNLESATVSLFSMSATLPLSILVLLVYLLGIFTGGLLLQSCAHGSVAPALAATKPVAVPPGRLARWICLTDRPLERLT